MAQLLGFTTRQVGDPDLGAIGDDTFSRVMRGILYAHLGAYLEALLSIHFRTLLRVIFRAARDLAFGLAGMIPEQDLRALDVTKSGGLRLANPIEMRSRR